MVSGNQFNILIIRNCNVILLKHTFKQNDLFS